LEKKISISKVALVGWMVVLIMVTGFELLGRDFEQSTLNLTLVKEKILETGDNKIHGFTYYDGYLWASTMTSPARILKIDSQTLDYQRIILDEGLNDGEDLIYAKGYIWVVLYISPSKIIKVDPYTLDWEIAVAFKFGEVSYGGSLEYAFGYLWAGGNGKIAKIDLENLRYQIYDYSNTVGDAQFHALTNGGDYIWGSCPRQNFLGINPTTTILRINPNDPKQFEQLWLDDIVTDDMFYLNGSLYAGTESEWKSSWVYKISNDLTFTKEIPRNTKCYGLFYQQSNGLWGAYSGNPGKIIQFDLNLTVEGIYILPQNFNHANEIAFDEKGNIYITCWENPSKIVKLTHNLS
jgi:hypothetical protein